MEAVKQDALIDDIPGSDRQAFGEKLDGIEYIDRVAVYGIAVDGEGKVATVQTRNLHFLPGGGVESGEDNKACLEREFVEETGYKIRIEGFVGSASLYHLSRCGRYLNGIGYFYIVSLECKCGEPEEGHQLVWLEPSECIRSLCMESQAWAVSECLKRGYLTTAGRSLGPMKVEKVAHP